MLKTVLLRNILWWEPWYFFQKELQEVCGWWVGDGGWEYGNCNCQAPKSHSNRPHGVGQGSSNPSLGDHCHAEFSSNSNQRNLNKLIKVITARWVWAKLCRAVALYGWIWGTLVYALPTYLIFHCFVQSKKGRMSCKSSAYIDFICHMLSEWNLRNSEVSNTHPCTIWKPWLMRLSIKWLLKMSSCSFG